MLLQVTVIEKETQLAVILNKFMEAGIKGTTVLDCHGSLHVLAEEELEHPPIFASLRMFLHSDKKEKKMLLTVVDEEKEKIAHDIVLSVLGDISKPNTGIIFALPLAYAEGIL